MNFDFLSDYSVNENAAVLKAELEWINALSVNENRVYDGVLNKARDYLKECIKKDGALTEKSVREAEKLILPLSERCKKDVIMCVSHAHIDMNWVWGYDETVAVTLATYRTMLDLLAEYHDFIFTHSQASTIKIVEEFAPEMLEEIKKYVKAGRWEIIASTWVENDKNLTQTESMARHIMYTEKYLTRLFGFARDYYTIDFEPDTFGHCADLPEILARNGIKYYYHGRGANDEILRNWVAPSGRGVVLFREPLWYSGEIEFDKFAVYAELMHRYGLNRFMHLYGVGDHGGGATRRDLERIKKLNAAPCMPRFEFSKMHDFFDYVEKHKDKFKTFSGELNPVFRGCYTSQSRIKRANALSERKLIDSERFISIAGEATGENFELDEKAWINQLFNQFHDILPGSCVISSREHALALSQETSLLCGIAATRALKKLASGVKCDDSGENGISEAYGAGVGFYTEKGIFAAERGSGNRRAYLLVNACDQKRFEPVELQLWDYEGDARSIRVKNARGEVILSEVGEKKGYQGYWYTPVVALCEIPPLGYTVVYVGDDGERKPQIVPEANPRLQPLKKFVLDNGIIRAEFSEVDGSIISLIDLRTQKEMISAPSASIVKVVEDGKYGMTSWTAGTIIKREKSGYVKIDETAYKNSGLLQKFAYRSIIGTSDVCCEVILRAESDTLEYNLTVNYKEFGSPEKGEVSGLKAEFYPAADRFLKETQLSCEEFDCSYGETCFMRFVSAEKGDSALTFTFAGKHGATVDTNGRLDVSLIRASFDPDPFPENYVHEIKFFITVGKFDVSVAKTTADRLTSNVAVLSVPRNTRGVLPSESSMFGSSGKSVISSVNYGKNKIILHVYNPLSETDLLKIDFKKYIKSAAITDLFGNPAAEKTTINGKSATFEVPCRSYVAIEAEFAAEL